MASATVAVPPSTQDTESVMNGVNSQDPPPKDSTTGEHEGAPQTNGNLDSNGDRTVSSGNENSDTTAKTTGQSTVNGNPEADDGKNDAQQCKEETQRDDEEPEPDSADRRKEAQQAFLDMFARLRRDVYPPAVEGMRIQNAHDYILECEAMMPLDWRTRRARDLSFALQAYIRLMDERLSALEEQGLPFHDRIGRRQRSPSSSVASASRDERTAENTKPEETKSSSGSIATVKRITWPEFKRQYEGKRDVSEEHAIDVLIGDAAIPHEVWRDRFARSNPEHLADRMRRMKLYPAWMFINLKQDASEEQQDQTDTKAKKENEPAPATRPTEITRDFYPPVPDRIRINGEPLKQLLGKALDVDFQSSGDPVVLLQPFKLLVYHKERILSLHKQLKHKFANAEVKAAPRAQAGGDQEGENLLERYGTEQAYKELECLVEFMEKDLRVLKHFEDASVEKIAFSDLWHIFQPGVEVITVQHPISAYRILHVTGGRPFLSPPDDKDETAAEDFTKPYRIPEKSSDFVVSCYQIDFDGNKFGPVAQSFSIQKFDGLRDITTLPVYPLKFAKDPSRVRETLLQNGKLFLDVCGGEHVRYRGLNLHEVEEIDSEIVVDFHAALWDNQDKDKGTWDYRIEFGIHPPIGANHAEVVMASSGGCKKPGCCENDHVYNDLNLDHQRMEDFLADRPWLTTDIRYLTNEPRGIPRDDLILFPHRLFAFVLKDRKWAVVDINSVKRVPEPNKDTWKSLVLQPGHKDMVYSLVQSHFRDRKRPGDDDERQADLVRGKGKGLIILLHGAPGVGKTSTAECVAELCKRPLYPITCGDLGITAVEVETRLKRIFIQAQKWKCVLLLDEADVFLSERENNVKHNSLVSVFLRVLEYYQGILFLTTNRVGKMDEAFRSRVHISLYYPPLDQKSTIEIFKSNLDRTAQRKKDRLRIRGDEIIEFAEDHYSSNDQRVRWNGRQIRNAFHIAVALAENEAVEAAEAAERAAAAGEKPNGRRTQRKPTLRARHFQVVEEASSKFDEYLTSVLGMAQAERARQQSHRQDDWEQRKDRKGQQDRDGHRRRRPKRYGGDETDSEDDHHHHDDHNDGGGGGRWQSPQEKKDARVRDSRSDSQSDAPQRRNKKTRGYNDTDGSEDEPNARERKRDAERKETREKDQASLDRDWDRGWDRNRDRDREYKSWK